MQAKQYYRAFYESMVQYDTSNLWNSVFIAIREDAEQYIKDNGLTFKEARQQVNADKNRYLDVAPFDQCRVRLSSTDTNPTGYINASPVVIAEAKRNYILCQGPLDSTCGDFWQMVWEKKVPLIVMLNRLIENNNWKCHDYYPMNGKDHDTFGNWRVRLIEEIDKNSFYHRKIELTNGATKETREVHQIQYIEWPDFGVPRSTKCFLEMMNYCIGLNMMPQKLEDAPVIVHCSAGIGRSGSFVFIDSILRMCELDVTLEGRIEEHVLRMRRSRFGLIQTPFQLRFAWVAIVNAIEVKYGLSPESLDDVPAAKDGDDEPSGSNEKKDQHEPKRDTNNRKEDVPEQKDVPNNQKSVVEKVETREKRREMIDRMVEKSRAAENTNQNGANYWKLSISVGAIAMIAGGFAYFLSNQRGSL